MGDIGEAAPVAVELTDVSRNYSTTSEKPALSRVSLTIKAGEFVAIQGPSGAGKSTMLNLIGLLDRPDSGRYLLFSQDTVKFGGRSLDRARGADIGFIFQRSHMLADLDVISNVRLGLRCQNVPEPERTSRALAALSDVGLGSKAYQVAKSLSGGEQQRAAVARALATLPRLILADEPTGNLDSANGNQVVSLLRMAHAKGTTVVIITHDPTVARAADRIVELRDGSITADSTADLVTASAPPSCAVTMNSRFRARASDTVADALAGVMAKVSRAILLTLSFAVGVAGLLGAVGLSATAGAQVAGRITAASMDQFYAYPAASSPERSIPEIYAMTEAVSRVDHVRDVGAIINVGDQEASVFRYPMTTESQVTLHGVTGAYAELASSDLVPRHVATLLDRQDIGPVAVISRLAAEELQIPYGPQGPGVGAVISVNGTLVPVVGVFNASERAPETANGVFVSLSMVNEIANTELRLAVVTEPGFPAAVARVIPLTLSPENPASVRVETVADLQGLRLGVSQDLAAMVAIVGAIVLSVASLGAATTLRLSVEARSSEIALRRALGATRLSIATNFLLEGLIVGVAGGALGAVLGQVAVIGISALREWAPVLPADAWWQGIFLGAITGLASAAQPAWRASRKEPALAILG